MSTPTPAASATSTPPPHTKFAHSPRPKTYDPLLVPGNWGYHSPTRYETRLEEGVTTALHQNLEQVEYDRLTAQQSDELLDIFEDSAKINRIIREEGGCSADASRGVMAISASDDVGVDTPWVTATLRADFATRDGLKSVECVVYRQKTRFGLDNRPFVNGCIVGYQDANGDINNPVHKRL